MAKVRVIPSNNGKVGKLIQHQDKESKKTLRVAAYCRVSTEYEEQAGSYATQVEHYTAEIEKNPDWQMVKIYADEGISATNTFKREEFNQMIADAEAGKMDLILTKSISRFARNTIDCLQYIRKLKAWHVPVYFEKENINTLDAKGEVLLTIMASLAQQESESLSRNVTMGIRYRFQQGKVLVSTKHFLGFDKDENGQLVVNQKQAEVVKRIFYGYLNGKTTKQIAKELEKDQVPTGAGNPNWGTSTISKILRNEKYIGDALLQKSYTVDFLTKRRIKNDGEVPQYYVENDHPAIIPKAVFYKVQKILDKRRDGFTVPNGTRHKYSNKYCFSCIVYCGHCKDIYCRNIWYTDGRKAVWRCYTRRNFNHRRGRGRRCPGRNVLEKDLEQATLMAFNQLIQQHHLADEQINQNIMKVINNTDGPTLDEVNAQLDRAQKKLLETATMGDDYQGLIDHIKSLRQQQAFLSNQQVEHAVQKDSLGEIQKLFEENQGGLLEFDPKLVRLYVEKIQINDKTYKFTFMDGEEITIDC